MYSIKQISLYGSHFSGTNIDNGHFYNGKIFVFLKRLLEDVNFGLSKNSYNSLYCSSLAVIAMKSCLTVCNR